MRAGGQRGLQRRAAWARGLHTQSPIAPGVFLPQGEARTADVVAEKGEELDDFVSGGAGRWVGGAIAAGLHASVSPETSASRPQAATDRSASPRPTPPRPAARPQGAAAAPGGGPLPAAPQPL